MRPLLKLVPDNTNIDFMRARWIAIFVSIALVGASLALLATRGLNFGVDFVGGQLYRVTFAQPPQLDQLRDRIQGLGQGEASIQQFGSPRDVSIRLPLAGSTANPFAQCLSPQSSVASADEAQANRSATQLRTSLERAYPGIRFNSVETVSGKVSCELFEDGGLSLLFAMLGISLYIWFRFEWQFGVGALVSLLHDLTITLGFYSLTQIEFSLNAVAALLTLIGYSLNDTVVVYDRIRENLRKYRQMHIEPLLNLSVNETLSRTIATNGAVLLAVLALVLIGPETIFGLTIGILFGVIVGTYSSIYVARFLLVPLGVNASSFVPKGGAPENAERLGQAERVPRGK
jgi:preprotein translocase subunit SecF